MEEILTIQDAAEYLKVSTATVYRMAQAGELPGFRIGRSWRFKPVLSGAEGKELIDEWIRRNTASSDGAQGDQTDKKIPEKDF